MLQKHAAVFRNIISVPLTGIWMFLLAGTLRFDGRLAGTDLSDAIIEVSIWEILKPILMSSKFTDAFGGSFYLGDACKEVWQIVNHIVILD